MSLTKTSLINKISKVGFDKPDSIIIMERLLDIMKITLVKGEDVLVSGFGKFCVKEKQERRGRNPATGEEITLDKKRIVTFKCSGKLKNMVNARGLTA